jgi:hypothetical protein
MNYDEVKVNQIRQLSFGSERSLFVITQIVGNPSFLTFNYCKVRYLTTNRISVMSLSDVRNASHIVGEE